MGGGDEGGNRSELRLARRARGGSGWGRTAGTRRFTARGQFESPTFDGANPLTEDVRLVLRNADGVLACCAITADHWMPMGKRHYAFWDRRVTLCPPIGDLSVITRNGKRSRVTVLGPRVDPGDFTRAPLGLTIQVGNRCAAGSFTPRTR